MMDRLGIVAVAALTATVGECADAMPVTQLGLGCRLSVRAENGRPSGLTTCSSPATLHARGQAAFSFKPRDARGTSEIQPAGVAPGYPSIPGRWLCGLVAFPPALRTRKRLLGFLLDWCCVDPRRRLVARRVSGLYPCTAPDGRLIQPRSGAADCQSEYHQGTIASLIREAQFTSTVLTSRGPP
jgi:hypothetical protein